MSIFCYHGPYHSLIHCCVWDVVFGGNRSNSTVVKASTSGWAGQLSIIIAIFLPSFSISLSTSFIHSSNSKKSIQLYFGTCNDTAVVLHVWSTLVFHFCQWQTSQFLAEGHLQQKVPVDLTLPCFLLNTFCPSCALFSSANLGKMIQIRRHYITEVVLESLVGSDVSYQDAVISGVTEFDSPQHL